MHVKCVCVLVHLCLHVCKYLVMSNCGSVTYFWQMIIEVKNITLYWFYNWLCMHIIWTLTKNLQRNFFFKLLMFAFFPSAAKVCFFPLCLFVSSEVLDEGHSVPQPKVTYRNIEAVLRVLSSCLQARCFYVYSSVLCHIFFLYLLFIV